jgi:hypothetical protein
MPSPKKLTKPETYTPCKDWHGMHWHVVGWLSAITLLLSGSTMALSASAATTPVITPLVLYRSLGDIHTKLNRIEAKIDQLQAAQAAPAMEAPSKALAAPAPNNDPTVCRNSCEDDFNACAKAAGPDQQAYLVCKNGYVDCFNKCGQ